jgi:hypothetical protein
MPERTEEKKKSKRKMPRHVHFFKIIKTSTTKSKEIKQGQTKHDF